MTSTPLSLSRMSSYLLQANGNAEVADAEEDVRSELSGMDAIPERDDEDSMSVCSEDVAASAITVHYQKELRYPSFTSVIAPRAYGYVTKRDALSEFLVMEIRPGKGRDVYTTSARALLSSITAEIQTMDPQAKGAMVDGQSAVSSLRHRDIRRLEHQFGSRCQSCVIVKRHAVLLVMDPIRAIIMADRVILLVPDAGDRLLAAVESNVLSDESEGREGRVLLTDLAHAASPFEALMYDALLTTVLDMETTEFIALSGVAASLLHLMNTHDGTSGISAKQQEELLYLKEHLGQLALRIKGNRRAIADVLEDDSAMALMSLSALRTAPHLYNMPLSMEIMQNHEDIEDLIELYLLDYSSLLTQVEHLRERIKASESLISLRLEMSQNILLTSSVSLNILSCAVGAGLFFANTFGMNLDAGIGSVKNVFTVVFSASFAFICSCYLAITRYFEYKELIVIESINTKYLLVIPTVFYVLFVSFYFRFE